MNWKHLTAFITALLLILLFVFATRKGENKNFEKSKNEIVIRKIGHEILLHSGDSTSRVLPVKQLTENEYQIQFESRLTFIPDSLVNIIHRIITANKLPSDYIVNVKEGANNEVIFGYAMLGTEQNNIVPCTGRKQPESQYLINLKFQNSGITNLQKSYLIAGLSLLGICLFLYGAKFLAKRKPLTGNNEKNAGVSQNNGIQIGKYTFFNEEQYLAISEEKINLTIKESKLLYIFATAPNQIIDRQRLQKEVWEDDGVIVGRSLDMFVSKLRKKLDTDLNIKLVNIHGKGYKLEINP